MPALPRRRIGRTALEVTELGFGSAPIGNLYSELPDAQAEEAVQAAFDGGIALFDTAPFYGHGLSEHRVGRGLRERPRDDYVISTKVGRVLRACEPEKIPPDVFSAALPFLPVFDYSYDGVMRSFEDSLQRLGERRIDLLLIHDLDVWTHGDDVDARFREVMDGGYRALEELRAAGVIAAIGCGLNEVAACERMAHAGDFDCFLLASRYTLLVQEALDAFLPLCEEREISVIIGGPYNTGILATGPVDGATYDYAPAPPEILERVRRIERVCTLHGVALASAALQFPLGHPRVASVIPGARSSAEVHRNLETFTAAIPNDLWRELQTEGLLPEAAPFPEVRGRP